MNNYTILSMKKYHTMTQLKGLQDHNTRTFISNNVDVAKSAQNRVLYSVGESYTSAWRDIITNAELKYNKPIKVRKNAVVALEYVASFSNNAIDDVDISRWADKTFEWFKERFGEENIIACTLHVDEATPHIHAEIVPIDNRGRLCAKKVIEGAAGMRSMHTSYAEKMGEFGLVRGERYSKSKKVDLHYFYQTLNKTVEAALLPRTKDEDDLEYIERLERFCKSSETEKMILKMKMKQELEKEKTRTAQDFAKFSYAISLYEDLYEKYHGDTKKVNKRLTEYRKIENQTPDNALSVLISGLMDKFGDRATPLKDWRKKGRRALDDVEVIDNNQETSSSSYMDNVEDDFLFDETYKEKEYDI